MTNMMHPSLVSMKRFEITYWNGYMMRVVAPTAAVAIQAVLHTPGYTFYSADNLTATEIAWPKHEGQEMYGVC